MGEACIFCRILAGELPASIVAEEANVVAFMDQRQMVPGHVLVVPRRHAPTIYELAFDDGSAVMRLAIRVARALRCAYALDGLNLWQSNGEAAGQEVDHFHLHVHPRQYGDELMRAYPNGLPESTAQAQLDKLAERLRPHL